MKSTGFPVKTALSPTHLVCLRVLLAAVVLLSAGAFPVQARPEYARKESRPCQYCHLSSSPDLLDPATGKREPTTRSHRGVYYETHNHTLVGYVEPAARPTRLDPFPVFRLQWSAILEDQPRRIGIADVRGDGTVRFITLNEKNEKGENKESTVLAVRKWDGKTFVTEFSAETQSPPDRLATGKFIGPDRPAVIVTADALWHWNGSAFVRKPAVRKLAILGTTRSKTGEERILIAFGKDEAKAYRVDPDAPGDWLVDGVSSPPSSQVSWGDLHGTLESLNDMGVPPALANGGLVGLWVVPKFTRLYLYYAKANVDADVQEDAQDKKKQTIVVRRRYSYVTFRDPSQANGQELWSTPKLPGHVLDVAAANARGDGKPGLTVLTTEAPGGKGRCLYFFALE